MRPQMIEKIEAAFKENPEHLGVKVGILCVRGDVPISFVEGVMGSNPVSVRRWMTGATNPQHTADVRKLKRLCYTLEHAISQALLPTAEKFTPELLLPLWAESKASV